jgi:hypothetical protein
VSADYVKQYTQSMKMVMQQGSSRLGDIVPREVHCSGCYARPSDNFNCSDCANTRRCPIPWAEVMNVRG